MATKEDFDGLNIKILVEDSSLLPANKQSFSTAGGITQLSPRFDAVVSKAERKPSPDPIGAIKKKSTTSVLLSEQTAYTSSNHFLNAFQPSPNTLTLFTNTPSEQFIKSISPTISPHFSPSTSPKHPSLNDFMLRKDIEYTDDDESKSEMSYHEDFISFMGGMDGIEKRSPMGMALNHHQLHTQVPSSMMDDFNVGFHPTGHMNASYHHPNNIGRVMLGPQDQQEYNFSSSAPNVQDEMDSVIDNQSNEQGSPQSSALEHPLGEHPSRTLFVRNISSNVDDEQLRDLFEAYGPIRSMYTQCKHRGFVMISYYDIRHAKAAMKHLQHKIINRRKIDIHYSIPKENPSEKDLNQGTLVVFNLDASITNEDLKKVFGKHGEIKEIRETPNKKHHKFIEFYDVRDAEKAMKLLNKTELKGKKIKIEPSRPGGARRTNGPSNSSTPSSSWNGDGLLGPNQDPEDSIQAQTYTYQNFGSPNTVMNSPHSIGKMPTPIGFGSPMKNTPPTMASFSIPSTSPATNTPPKWNTVVASSPQKAKPATNGTSTTTAPAVPIVEAVAPNSAQKEPRKKKDQDNKKLFALDLEKVKEGLDKRTTLMIKNIPNKYTQKMLLQTIDQKFKGHYDFFYLPIDFKNKCNVGYAFINFINPLSFISFCDEFNNRKWEKFNSEKVCEITYARIQGKTNLISHFQNSSLMVEDPSSRPIFFL